MASWEVEAAMEWGFKASEKGLNLEAAREEFQKLYSRDPHEPREHNDADGVQGMQHQDKYWG